MANVYDKAYELKREIEETAEFKELVALHEEVERDDIAKKLLENFRNLQIDLQKKQMQGIQITEEDAIEAQRQFEAVQQHELISKLMNAEQRLSIVITDINKIITEPLEQMYGPLDE